MSPRLGNILHVDISSIVMLPQVNTIFMQHCSVAIRTYVHCCQATT